MTSHLHLVILLVLLDVVTELREVWVEETLEAHPRHIDGTGSSVEHQVIQEAAEGTAEEWSNHWYLGD